MDAQLIKDKLNQMLEGEIKTYPCRNLRASNLGHPCERYLYLLLTKWEEQKPHDAGLQAVFDLGNHMETLVFDPNGISPTIMAGGGGGTETKIIAIRGRQSGQVIEPNYTGLTNALTTVQKDNMVVEQKAISRNYRAFIEKKGYIPELFNPWNKREIKDISPTQTANCGSNFGSSTVLKAEQCEVNEYLRIRKLTPRECWRLMGWKDEQIDKVQAAGISNCQMYKQAGNGIVVNVLEAIFKNLLMI